MKVTIHRGTKEIGGTCIQLVAGGRSILLDAGLPLGDSDSFVDLENIDFSDVLISHPHKDHYGMIDEIGQDKTVHVGQLGQKLIDAGRIFMGNAPLQNRFRYFENRVPFEIGPFAITPYLMDHSSVDAFGFLIEAAGKRVYYSGDFRGHGMKEKAFKWFLSAPPKDIDLLLLEGTMMSRIGKDCDKEKALEQEIVDILKSSPGACFMIGSGQHIDRLCAAFRACKKSGRLFALDIYTAYIMHLVSKRFDSVPGISDKHFRVLTKGRTASAHYSRVVDNKDYFKEFTQILFNSGNQIDIDAVVSEPGKYLLKVSKFNDILKALGDAKSSVIYSQWEGYKKEEFNPNGFSNFVELENNPNINFYNVHTSGHASINDLKKLAKKVDAKLLVPIHTEHAEGYKDYFANVQVMNDGEVFEV